MTTERKGNIQFEGKEVTIVGDDLNVGQIAPEFHAFNNQWELIKVLESTKNKVRIIGSFLSLNTSVCDRETRKFNQEASALGADIVVLLISMDLPFTQKDWCAAAGIDRVVTLSDHLDADFGRKYGVLLKEVRFLRRAIFVVDRNGKIVYVDYMKMLGEEPNYQEVLDAARRA